MSIAILIYQAVIFSIIVISAYSGRRARNIAVIGTAIFTLVNVFMPWLVIVQLITILIAYGISSGIVERVEEKRREREYVRKEEKDNWTCGEMMGCLILVVAAIALISIFLFD